MKKEVVVLLITLSVCVVKNYAQSDNFHTTINDTIPGAPHDTTVQGKPLLKAADTTFILNKEPVETVKRKNHSSGGVYEFHPAADIPILAVGSGWSLFALTKIYKKGSSSEQEILNLKT